MKLKLITTSSLILLVLPCSIIGSAIELNRSTELPPIETFCMEPFRLEYPAYWVPAAKPPPSINMSCRAKKGCRFATSLPAEITHTKTKNCPPEIARLLAEKAADRHKNSLPLTFSQQWKWEYQFNLAQFQMIEYNLSARGGSWENCWEAIINQTEGSGTFTWLPLTCSNNQITENNSRQKTNIDVKTFSSMRIRDGYPKKRKMQN